MSEETTWNPEELAKKIKEELLPVQRLSDKILVDANLILSSETKEGDAFWPVNRDQARCVIVAWLKDALEYWEKKP